MFGRAESIDSDELVPAAGVQPAGELTLGAVHDWRVAEHAKLGLGALYSFDFVPSLLTPGYGDNPHGTMVFVRAVAE